MNFSIPTLLVAAFALFCEVRIQQKLIKFKQGEIFYLKLIDMKYRYLVYILNTGIAFYNYMTGFDDYIMAGVLMISIHLITNISKIVVEKDLLIIGNTKIKPEDFTLVELKALDDKNAKFTFGMMVRKRRFEKDLYIPINQLESLKKALDQFKPSTKNITHKNAAKHKKK